MDKILLVLPPLNDWASDFLKPDLGYAYALISLLTEISHLTIFVPSDDDVKKYDDYLKSNFGFDAKVISFTELNRLGAAPRDIRLIEEKPFVDQSLRIYEYISQSYYQCVIFDIFGATGFIPIRAKRVGLGLEKTLLVSWLRTCHEFQRNQVLKTSRYPGNFLTELEIDFAERYCCQHSDLVLVHSDAIEKWVLEQKWKLDPAKSMLLADLRVCRSLKPVHTKLATFNSSQLHHPLQSGRNNPLLSICIAHFNDGRNLRYLLKSIEENDYKNFEVIVVDDASTQAESLEIFTSLVSEYATGPWQFIMKNKNEGPGPTRNFAVEHARGEFIFFLDSDDLATKTLFSDFVRGMLHSSADCLTCPLVYFEGDGGTADSASLVHFWLPLGACLEVGIYNQPFGGANFCIKKSVFETLGGFSSPHGENHEEWEFLARLVLAGFDLDVVPKASYYYRVRPSSWLHTARSSIAVQNIRKRLLDSSGFEHKDIIHDLLLRTIAENDRLRAATWQLDRKIVKISLKLIEVLNEKKRVSIENLAASAQKKMRSFFSRINRVISHSTPQADSGVRNLSLNQVEASRFFARSLPGSQKIEALKNWELPLERPIFGLVGEKNEKQRFMDSLRLAYWMQMSKDDSFFILLGHGSVETEIRTTAMKYYLKNFKWIPCIDKSEEFYAILSGLVITSRSEKIPIEMVEALARGVPVFSTDVGEAEPVLRHYGSGIVVSHDPQHKDFADCFSFWKNNLEIYKMAAMETAGLIQINFRL